MDQDEFEELTAAGAVMGLMMYAKVWGASVKEVKMGREVGERPCTEVEFEFVPGRWRVTVERIK